MDSKIKTRITKSAIILFMLAVDLPLRFVLFSTGLVASFFGIFLLLLDLGNLVARVVDGDTDELFFFMYLLSTSIMGIAALRVAFRAQLYRYNPPYLDREIINKRTTVIPLSVLGISSIFYMVSQPYGSPGHAVDMFLLYIFYTTLQSYGGPDHPVVTSLLYMKLIGIVGFLYAILETIILRRVVLASGSTNEALASDAATLASDAATKSTGTYAYVTRLQGDGSTWWGSWLILIMGLINSAQLTALCLRWSLLSEADLLARTDPGVVDTGVWGTFSWHIIFIWGLVLLHFARRYLLKISIEQLAKGAKERAVMGVVVMCDVIPFIVLAQVLSNYMRYNDRLPLYF